MPVVIARGRTWMPVVAEAATDEDLLQWLEERRLVPRDVRADVAAARAWFAEQPWPYGWFETMETARSRLRRRQHTRPIDGGRPAPQMEGPGATGDADAVHGS